MDSVFLNLIGFIFVFNVGNDDFDVIFVEGLNDDFFDIGGIDLLFDLGD